MLDVDPVEWLTSEFAGDWQKVAQAASALRQLGEYTYALAADIDQARTDLGAEWTGNASSNAATYFDELAAAVGGLTGALQDVAHAFSTTATGIKMWGDAIADALSLLLDRLIELGIAALAAGAFSFTGVGLLAGAASTAYLVYRASAVWIRVVEAHGMAAGIARGVVGLSAGGLSLLHVDGADLTLPGSYDHPAV